MKIYFAIGSVDNARLKVFQDCGVERVLVSFADSNGKAEIKLPFSDIMLDSGAYGVGTGTQAVTVEAYALWLELYLDKYPQIKVYVNLDDLNNPEVSFKNQEYLESLGLKPLPVYHYGEPVEYLDKMCTKYKYVGLGGLAVGTMPAKNLRIFWEWAQERHKDNNFHLFGAMAMSALTKYQPYSLDSSSWAVGTKYRRLAGYKDGLPAWFQVPGKKEGWKIFFTSYELWSNNVRALLDWEKLEWLKSIKNTPNEDRQERMF